MSFLGVSALLIYLVGWLAAVTAAATFVVFLIPYPMLMTRVLESTVLYHPDMILYVSLLL